MKSLTEKKGLPPGTIIYVGNKSHHKVQLNVYQYDLKTFKEFTTDDFETIELEENLINWINIDGLTDIETIEKIGTKYNLHPLVLEDVVSTAQRPKFDEYEEYLYAVIKMIYYDENEELVVEQLSFIFNDKYLLSFQELPEDVLQPVRLRIKESKGRIRKLGTDYLLFALMDAVVDNYFMVLENLGDKIDALENKLVENQQQNDLFEIQRLKKEVLKIKRAIYPLREMISKIERSEHKLFKKVTNKYYRDLYDHTLQIIETVETYRDMLIGLYDIYMSSISNRMNNIMKVLTIMATIFIPLTFVAGVYGMNFEYMPELKWKYSYLVFWVVIIALFIGLIRYFKSKDWL